MQDGERTHVGQVVQTERNIDVLLAFFFEAFTRVASLKEPLAVGVSAESEEQSFFTACGECSVVNAFFVVEVLQVVAQLVQSFDRSWLLGVDVPQQEINVEGIACPANNPLRIGCLAVIVAVADAR